MFDLVNFSHCKLPKFHRSEQNKHNANESQTLKKKNLINGQNSNFRHLILDFTIYFFGCVGVRHSDFATDLRLDALKWRISEQLGNP